MSRPVVAGADGSPESLAAAEWAAREAVRRDVPLHLVHASDWSPDQAPSAAASVVRRHLGRGILRAAEDRAATRLVRAASGAGLLVVGRRLRETRLGRHTGPVTHSVIHHARCPVAVVAHG